MIAHRVWRSLQAAELHERRAIVKTAIRTRDFARIFRELEDGRVPVFEFDPISIRTGGVRRVENVPVAASGAVRYRWNNREFNFTPLDGPPGTGTHRAALNEWHAGMVGDAMFRRTHSPYVLAEPAVFESGRSGVIQFRKGRQIAVPPGRSHSHKLAAVDFVTNNVRDAHVGRPSKACTESARTRRWAN